MPVLLVFADNARFAEARGRVLRAFGRRGEGAGLVKYAALEIATGGRAWLQAYNFNNLAGGAADYRQVPCLSLTNPPADATTASQAAADRSKS